MIIIELNGLIVDDTALIAFAVGAQAKTFLDAPDAVVRRASQLEPTYLRVSQLRVSQP
jgi:hypothetical protein